MKDLQKHKFYTSACGRNNGNFLEPLGFDYTPNIEEADLILFGGGADVDPKTYGEEKGSKTYSSPHQETLEKKDFQFAYSHKIKCFGICRGHQLLVSLAGGKLVQHVTNHGGTQHSVTTYDGMIAKTNSLHHQMVNPYGMNSKDYRILAWSTRRFSDRYLGAKDKSILLPHDFKEIEAIYLPKINAMGVQYHPEMMYRTPSSYYTGDGISKISNEPIISWTQKTFLNFFHNKL